MTGARRRWAARTGEWLEDAVVFDLETTGLSPARDRIVEIGALRIVGGRVDEALRFETLVRPTGPDGRTLAIHPRAQQVHGISDAMVSTAPGIEQVLPEFLAFVGDSAVVGHNVGFDSGFMHASAERLGLRWAPAGELCTMQLSRLAFPGERVHNLGAVAERLGLSFAPGGRHRSFGDVQVTAQAYVRLEQLLAER